MDGFELKARVASEMTEDTSVLVTAAPIAVAAAAPNPMDAAIPVKKVVRAVKIAIYFTHANSTGR